MINFSKRFEILINTVQFEFILFCCKLDFGEKKKKYVGESILCSSMRTFVLIWNKEKQGRNQVNTRQKSFTYSSYKMRVVAFISQ